MIPACIDNLQQPRDGFESADTVGWLHVDLEDRDPCGYCFPDADNVEDIDYERQDLVVAKGEYANKIHRAEHTGDIEYNRRQTRDTKTLAEKRRDGELATGGVDE